MNDNKEDVLKMNTTALAFLGDAVYELYVREHLIKSGQIGADKMHRLSTRYVRASAQAAVIKEIIDDLPEEQQRLVKRARNHKSASRPKNADPVEYKWATAFEALVGYLYLCDDTNELVAVISKAIAIVDDKPNINDA